MQGVAAMVVASRCEDVFASVEKVSKARALPDGRPAVSSRRFQSAALDSRIASIKDQIAERDLATIFSNCYPNTLDTTVELSSVEGKPDTYVVTGDIDAMWLRDSSAQLWPYLDLAREDNGLRELIEGAIRRHAGMILLDPYANAFTRGMSSPALSWAENDKTEHRPGVAERKWEVDSLCYPIRLAYGYWKNARDQRPFDARWREAAWTVVRTMREQQRKTGSGSYQFQRESSTPTDTCALGGFGNPARPTGMIFSMFRPSDDACIYPLLVPSNLFAVASLRQLAIMAGDIYHDTKLVAEANSLAMEVEAALNRYGKTYDSKTGTIWAYEVDGYGSVLKMDDANAPGLLSLAYLGCSSKNDPLYTQTRSFSLSTANPYFFAGLEAEGIGGPHVGMNMIWPMSIILRALTANDEHEIWKCLRWIKNTTDGTGFMHESFHKDDASKYTRPWFAWANTLFGELVCQIARERPSLLRESFG
jgi:meiotically up-regulated gene 157 (Mug157) protein